MAAPRSFKHIIQNLTKHHITTSSQVFDAADRNGSVTASLLLATKTLASNLPGDQQETERDLLTQIQERVDPRQYSHGPNNQFLKKRYADRTNNPSTGYNEESVIGSLFAEEGLSRYARQNQYQDSYTAQHDPQFDDRIYQSGSVIGKLLRSRSPGLFDAEPFNIFTDSEKVSVPDDTSRYQNLWDKVASEKLERLENNMPKNGFDEMIKLTETGKLWKFPIDNEQDMLEEENVGFEDHVFLEHFIADLPKSGPVRHFMELVIIALAKNPFISVTEKREHIKWFRDYLDDKQILIDELTVQDNE